MSGRRKRCASRSPSPSGERARAGPLVLRPARAGEPSLADLPPELVELVVRCAAEDMHALERLGRVSRALRLLSSDLLPTVLIDHGVIVLRDGRWEFHCDKVSPLTRVTLRGALLAHNVNHRLATRSISSWLEVALPWRAYAFKPLIHLAQPWPTTAYSARLRALVDRHAQMCTSVFGGPKSFGAHHDLQEVERRLTIMSAIVDGSHAVMQAYDSAAHVHPTIFAPEILVGLKRGLFNQLLGGRSPIDHIAERLQIASAVFTAESRQSGVPSALLRNHDAQRQDMNKLIDQSQTPIEAVAAAARVTFRRWIEVHIHRAHLNAEALGLLEATASAGGYEAWMDVFGQAAATHAGRVLLRDMAMQYGSLSAPRATRARVFDNLLPHYLDALRACAAARPAGAP